LLDHAETSGRRIRTTAVAAHGMKRLWLQPGAEPGEDRFAIDGAISTVINEPLRYFLIPDE